MGLALTERGKATISLNGALQAQAGQPSGIGDIAFFPHNHEGRLPQSFAIQTIISGGTLSALSVDIEGSLDGVNFVKLDTLVNAAGEISSILGTPVPYLRANYKSGTISAGTPALTVLFTF